ncbi:MAG: 50S ribosomal protein L3 [Clostridia bacterium]|nr:50S ribosomal protein L3 [Clostridia bacterium]MBQ7914236.1 50S ribosomal protein L3 [Clostridia bacterium]MBQ8772811.1 50S ribosomal protein L3 [Clostridia bacterium]MBQ8872687.1 50S ribosomal protein L3 [Clostridia bacterium]MBQ9706869.1 50S ribosomal protein L3 [Clostridia bacterium]
MNKAIIGKKLGMTQVFLADGTMVPVTVIQAGPCTVTQKKTVERDGYEALQFGFETVAERKLTKPQLGHLKNSGVVVKHLHEFKLDGSNLEVGQTVTCDVFAEGDVVDVTGITKGHGFSGVIKRWNQHRLKETHGVGPVHREVGSMGPISSPSRVMPGKRLPGHYGVEQVTILNLSVVKVDKERGVILVKGAVPGAKNSIVYVRNAVKK